MAEGTGRDVVIDRDDWENSILKGLKEKDSAIKEMLDKFIEALEILVNDGFIRGTRHDNMDIFFKEVKSLRSQLDGIYDNAEKAINTLNSEADSVDQYTTSVFNLGG
ncbi:MAG: hypothetical protein NC548_54920 [Lachnospiraceae bacterium]|nr:hypothetical protein [Lachnospiraceae bacterium]MCM1230909.1 hypothetical protein [Ruminococcus flavefaciens]